MGQGKNGALECCAACGAATFCCLFAILVLALGGLGIAKIVIGALYLHNCDIQYLIPIYLIVGGVSPILLGGFGRRGDDDESGGNIGSLICGVIGFLFNIAWLICGSVWVYPNYGKLSEVDFVVCKENVTVLCVDKGCNETLLTFAFAVVTIDWIFMGLMVVLIAFLIGSLFCKR